uniref:Oryzain alpha chain n=1 Tax=Aegilops tauschii TaxID=37682 RepID=N1QTU5_AEGTA
MLVVAGRLMNYAYKFVINNGGSDRKDDYPFGESDEACNKNKLKKHVITIDGY